MNLKERAQKMKTEIPALVIAFKDPDTPTLAKLIVALVIGYALSPIDLIPDFIPVVGYLDDLLLLPGMIALAITLIPEQVMIRSRQKAKLLLEKSSKHWYYALPVILIWILVLMLVVKLAVG